MNSDSIARCNFQGYLSNMLADTGTFSTEKSGKETILPRGLLTASQEMHKNMKLKPSVF